MKFEIYEILGNYPTLRAENYMETIDTQIATLNDTMLMHFRLRNYRRAFAILCEIRSLIASAEYSDFNDYIIGDR